MKSESVKTKKDLMTVKHKKLLCLAGLLLLVISLAACGGTGSSDGTPGETSNPSGSDILTSPGTGRPGTATGTAEGLGSLEGAVLSQTEGIDIDVAMMSDTIAMAQMADFMYGGEEYIGKIVRVRGIFSAYHDKTTNKDYFGVIVQDATACCGNGIEFTLTDDYVFPDDYPNPGEEITVVGTFTVYDEGEYSYITLSDSILQ